MINIIVPIYNIEKYLVRCLNSIQKQIGEFKAILVDDGSTDSCSFLCEQYAKNDSRFIVLHKRNGGLSSAIKYGIINSSPCDYFMFVDGDDSLVENAVETIQKIVDKSGADLIMYDFYKLYDDGRNVIVTSKIPEGYSCNNAYVQIRNHFQRGEGFVPARWNKVYKSDIVSKIIPFYSDKVSVAEDMLFTTLALFESKSIYYEKQALVNYYQNSSSMMNNYKRNYVDSYIEVYRILNNRIPDKELPPCILFQNVKTLIQQIYNSDYKNKNIECRRILKHEEINSMIKTISCWSYRDKALCFLMKHSMVSLLGVLSAVNRKNGSW